MGKFGLIFKISLTVYLLILLDILDTSKSLDSIVVTIIVVYQLIYMFILRKKENIGFLKIIADLFWYLSFIVQFGIVYLYVDMFFNGFCSGLLSCNEKYYGFQAWTRSSLLLVFIVPALVICIIYQICYFKTINKSKKQTSITNFENL